MGGKARQRYEAHHVRLYASIMASDAWQHLSGNAVKVLLALAIRDNGKRNGTISFSCRAAAEESGVTDRTAWRCLIELQEKGFIACTQKGGFNRKVLHASLWRYTWAPWPGGKPAAPTRDFEKWRCLENDGCKICSRAVVVSDEPNGNSTAPVAEFTTENLETPDVSVRFHSANIATLILHQGEGSADGRIDQRKHAPFPSRPDHEFRLCDEVADLRLLTLNHIEHAGPGSQSRLASGIGCPPGTFSKFIAGRNLPVQYRPALTALLTEESHAA